MMITLLPILILIFIPIQDQRVFQGVEYGSISPLRNPEPILSIKGVTAYTKPGRIEIFNDSAFGPTGYDFDGSGTSNDPYLIHGYNITSDSGSSIHIENTTKHFRINNSLLNPLGTDYSGVYMKNATHGTIENNTIYNCSDAGIGVFSSENITISGNTILNCSGNGIIIDYSDQTTVLENTISNCSEVGIYLFSATNNTLIGNNIENCSTYGIHLESSSNFNTFTANTVHKIGGEGIYVTNSDNSTFMFNVVYDCNNVGIRFSSQPSSGYHIISNNTVYNCDTTGISMTACHNSTLSGNTVFNCSESAITILYAEYVTLSDNTIYNCSGESVLAIVDCYNNVTVTGNTIYNISATGIYVGGSPYTTLSDNLIYNLPTDGISMDSSINCTISGNTIYNCGRNGFDLRNSDYITLFDNTIYNCSEDGIHLRSSFNYNTISKNTIYYCSSNGLEMSDSDNNTISYNNVFNNTAWGLLIDGTSDDNNVTMNNFIDNNPDILNFDHRWSQAFHEGLTNNNISSNYWSDWISGNYSFDGVDHYNDSSPLSIPVPLSSTLNIDAPVTWEYDTDTITVILSGSSTIMYYSYYIDGIDSVNRTWTTSEDRILPDGIYTLHTYGRDILSDTVHESVTFTIDVYLPTAVITNPVNTTYTSTDVPLTYTATDYQTLTIYLNGFENTTAVPSGSVVSDFPDAPGIPDGSYNITIVAEDEAGNIAKDSIFFTIDTTGPIITIVSPSATAYDTGTITIELSSDDAVHYWFSIDGGPNQTWTTSVEESLSDGTYVLHAYGNDSFGNVGYANVTFTIEISTTTAGASTTTTTTTAGASTTTTTTTTEASPSSFPGFFTVLLFVTFLVVVRRRRKRT